MAAYEDYRKIFFSGIGGSGMSALALFDRLRGREVAGSDRAFDLDSSHPALAPLEASGVHIHPQDGSGLDWQPDLLVMSTAVEPDCPEVVRARELGIPVSTRPEHLEKIIGQYDTVAISGTSGKSTAGGMLAYAMRELGMEPNFLGGGRVKQFRDRTNPGNCLAGASDVLVAEACESDGSLVNFRPSRSVILNLSLDHKGLEETAGMFEVLASHTSGRTFVNADDKRLSALNLGEAYTFSIDNPSDLRAENLVLQPMGSELVVRGELIRLSLPGKHNVYNALSVIAVLVDMGVAMADAAKALEGFTGLERRFDVHLDNGTRIVVDDYAHNPHKITALIEAAGRLSNAICYIFQPHGYGPTKLMLEGYIKAFSRGLRNEDRLIVLPIYYAGGTASRDISSEDLAAGSRELGANAVAVASRDEALERAQECQGVVVLGARDETLPAFAARIARRLSSG